MQSNQEHKLPPGFRFHPTDEELILHYLRNQATSMPCPVSIIAEIDIYKFDPWELPAKAMFGEKEWYFFSPRDRKYPNGARPNRAAVSGYWKATGTDKPIVTTGRNENIGVKKALVFYKGRPPKGQKTNWIMHEYRLIETSNMGSCRLMKHRDSSMRLDDWVLCRIYEKNSHLPLSADQEHEEVSSEDTFQPNLPCENTFRFHESPSISDFFDKLDASMSSQFEINDDNNRNSDRNATESTFPKLGLIKSFNNFHQPRTHSASYTFNNDDPLHQNQNISQAGSTVTSMDNQLKRRRQMVENYSTPGSVHPLKKLNNSCISTNFNNQLVSSQSFFDAHILMNSQYGLQ